MGIRRSVLLTMALVALPASLAMAQPIGVNAIVEARPPVMMIPDADGNSVPVHVRSLDVNVEITGFLAETTLVMTFENPNDRILEGELIFPLPEGSTISGFGLDIGGELVDGVTIERHQARIAFEAETRVRVDPGLAEWVQGSSFRTRIYPFPAQGRRTIKVSYISDLTADGASATYHLPLAYQESLERFSVRAVVREAAAAPTVESTALSNLAFDSWESQFVAEAEMTDIQPAEDLFISVPLISDKPLVEVASDESVYFVVQDVLPALPATSLRPEPNRIVVVFDSSLSRMSADRERELELLRTFAEAHPETTIELVMLRDALSDVRTFAPSADRARELIYTIRDEPVDGGTDITALHFPRDLSELVAGAPAGAVDYYLLFSDGLGALGEPEQMFPTTPVITITSSADAHHAWLRHIAETSGGAYLNLQRETDEDALVALGIIPLRVVGIDYDAAQLEMLQLSSPLPQAGRVLVSGRLLTNEATLTVRYGLEGETLHTSSFVLNATDAPQGALVPRYWAQTRIIELALSADRYGEDLLDLGETFNLVTPNTSYLVLETLEQHLEHQIAPAASRPEMLAQYNAQVVTQQQNEATAEANRLNNVASAWLVRVGWWESQHPVAPTQVTTPTGEPNDQVGQTPVGTSPQTAGVETAPGTFSPTDGITDVPPTELTETLASPPVLSDLSGNADSDDMLARQVERSRDNREDSARREISDTNAPSPSTVAPVLADEESWDDFDEGEAIFGSSGSRAMASPESEEAPSFDGNGGLTATGGEGETSSGTIAVQAWSPDTPYLVAIRDVDPDDAYGVYLDYIHEYGRAPAFFLDVASYLYQVDKPVEARRVLTNISELELGDARLLRIVAYKLQEEGELDLAIRIFGEVYKLRPEEPQSRRDLALALAERADMTAAQAQETAGVSPMADWARAEQLLDAMVRSDTGRFLAIEMPAVMEANRIRAHMTRYSEEHDEALPENPLDPRLQANLELDVRVILRWDTDETDMDLWVTEPNGERCYYANTRTAYGAMYGRDYTIGYGPEEYLIRYAPDGGYLVEANFYGSRQQSLTGGTTLQVDIFTDWGRATEQRHRGTLRLTSQGETVTVGTVSMGDEDSVDL